MGVYIEGLDRPRNEYMRIHIDFDGEVWVFRGSGWKSLGIKATNLDLVRCKECIHKTQALSTEKGATGCELISGTFYEDFFCKEGKRKADYTVFTVNPPKGIETPLKGDATAFHQNSEMDENVARPTATSSTEVPWWLGE